MEVSLGLIMSAYSHSNVIFIYSRPLLLLDIERLQQNDNDRNKNNANNLDIMFSGWIQKNLEQKLNVECTDKNLSDALLGIKNALEVLGK